MEKMNIPLSVPNLSKDILPMIEECIETGWVSTGGRFISQMDKIEDFVKIKKENFEIYKK